jgi:hypothetical protein
MPRCRLLVALALLVSLGMLHAADEVKLFNGKDLTGLRAFPAGLDSALKVEDGVIVVSGKPAGYFYTDKGFKNYVLTFDWKYARPAALTDDTKFNGNSGCLLHITGDHKVWPKSVEIQGMNKNHGQVLAVSGAQVSAIKDDKEARAKAVKKVGEWNTTEITVKDGKITTKVNGVPVSSCETTLMEGPIGFQSEGAEIHFRNIMLKETK